MKNRQSHQISRRQFLSLFAASGIILPAAVKGSQQSSVNERRYPVRLGGPVFDEYNSPEEWVSALRRLQYSAAYCPVGLDADLATIRAYERAAKDSDIIIAEVGAWSNPISPNDTERKNAIQKCKDSLQLAEAIGAKCCVNISGSRGKNWAGHHPDNFTTETFDMIVEVTQEIIDTVNPRRTYFTLETMPWAYPDSPDSYVELIEAIDRRHFAVHLDPVNMVCSPQRYYGNAELIRESFRRLGPWLKSCHGKDILLGDNLTTHLDEVRPGTGGIDYAVFLDELGKFRDVPLMLEHLPNAVEYQKAADYVRAVGAENNIPIMNT